MTLSSEGRSAMCGEPSPEVESFIVQDSISGKTIAVEIIDRDDLYTIRILAYTYYGSTLKPFLAKSSARSCCGVLCHNDGGTLACSRVGVAT